MERESGGSAVALKQQHRRYRRFYQLPIATGRTQHESCDYQCVPLSLKSFITWIDSIRDRRNGDNLPSGVSLKSRLLTIVYTAGDYRFDAGVSTEAQQNDNRKMSLFNLVWITA